MRNDKLIYKTDIKLVFDNDCESAAIAIAKTMDNYTACNNLRDIRPLIDNNKIIAIYDEKKNK